MGRILRIFLTGVLALLPIAVTFFVVAWVGSFVAGFAGRGSFIGGLITRLGNSLGLTIEPTSGAAYLLGLAIIVGAIFLLGLLVESGLRSFIFNGLDWLIMRIPLVSTVYDLSKRFVAMVDRGGGEDSLKSMSPVWCFFGGEGSAAVLGLMPSPEPVVIGEHSYPWSARAVGAGSVRRRLDLCAVGVGQAGRGRRRAADERLCVDGRDAAAFAPQTGQARASQAGEETLILRSRRRRRLEG